MPRFYHLECTSGLAGDMFLGACLDLGMPCELLSEAVARLGLTGVAVEARRARRGALAGTRFRVLQGGHPLGGPDPDEVDEPEAKGRIAAPKTDGHHHQNHDSRGIVEIRRLLAGSGLGAAVRERAEDLFARLAEVEAGIHAIPLEQVHFHEVGAVDSIVDIVGAACAYEEYLRPDRITCGTVVVGSGWVATDHGVLPVPAPATAELLRGAPIVPGPPGELVTPTGALLLDRLVDEFTTGPSLIVEAHGYGLGRVELADRANAVRLTAGRPVSEPVSRREAAAVQVLECQIDDLSGEGFGYLFERLLQAGALDAYYTPVQMKKGRPGVLVTVLCRPEDLESLAATLMVESGSLGCRFASAQRFEAERDWVSVATCFGEVRIKRARFRGRIVAEAPEYEDCRSLAHRRGVPWREVYAAALAALAGQRDLVGGPPAQAPTDPPP